MTSRTLMNSDLLASPQHAFETALGQLHDIVTDRQAERTEQIDAAIALSNLILQYESNPIVGNRWGDLEIPVIR